MTTWYVAFCTAVGAAVIGMSLAVTLILCVSLLRDLLRGNERVRKLRRATTPAAAVTEHAPPPALCRVVQSLPDTWKCQAMGCGARGKIINGDCYEHLGVLGDVNVGLRTSDVPGPHARLPGERCLFEEEAKRVRQLNQDNTDSEIFMEAWARECNEWRAILTELATRGGPVTAHEVTTEHDRRLKLRGESSVLDSELAVRLGVSSQRGKVIDLAAFRKDGPR